MLTILWATGIIIVLYLIYPVGLCIVSSSQPEGSREPDENTGVSMILLTYNGGNHLANKIKFLAGELAAFENHELIIIDDNSTDTTQNILARFSNHPGIKVIKKNVHTGIADSMNLGVSEARYGYIVFCDQRQKLCPGSLQRIIKPLANKNIGAVSGCLSPFDKENCDSMARRHENFIKSRESKLGNVIGVYGPLYAIKKKYFTPIPGHIILDDLYLSLHILKSKQIVLINDCAIIDDNFSMLYNYQRTKRYLTGLLQLLFEKRVVFDLSNLQITMLMWHKYLRLLIPIFFFLSYTASAILIPRGIEFLILFCIMSAFGILAILQMIFKFQSGIINIVRMNLYYLVAFADIFTGKLLRFFHLNNSNNKTAVISAKNFIARSK